MKEEKLDPKELRQLDKIQKTLYTIVGHIHKNRISFIIGVVVVLAFFLGGWGVIQYQNDQLVKLTNQFNKIPTKEAGSTETKSAQEITQQLEIFSKENPDSFFSIIALIRLGEAYAKEQQWELAEQSFQKILIHPKADEFILSMTRVNLSSLYENQQKWSDAQKTMEALNAPGWEDFREKTLARIALSQGDQKAAKTHLENLVNKGSSDFAPEARTLLMTLK